MKNLLFVIILFLVGCKSSQLAHLGKATSVEGRIVQTSLLNCYPEGMKIDSVNYLYAETSAALRMGDEILIAIDKPTPNMVSPVFTIPLGFTKKSTTINAVEHYVMNPPFPQVLKIEAFTKSPNDSIYFATTGFDRIRGSAADWDGYNSLLAWRKKDFSDVQYVAGTERNGVTSSRDLRISIQKALPTTQFPQGAPYFKIEALVALPGNRLIFGVREAGESYQKFDYTFTLLETTYTDASNGIQISPAFKKIYEYKPVVNGNMTAISDLVYHAPSNSLIASTSREEGTDEKTKTLASYLWILSMDRLERGEAPLLVKNGDQPLEIPYKGEGLCFLNESTIFIVCDEDRKDSNIQFNNKTISKKPNQAIFSIVRLR
ncbi:MAG: hypothetical protein SFU99_11075 [Saprospiraceae bacterium]|nr:hypothetical protein [Saprospiraceae bacterium]